MDIWKMNERIKELAEQAGEAVVNESFDEYMLTETEDGATLKVPSIFIKKFAELLIQDCASLLEGFTLTQEVALDEYVDFEASEVLLDTYGIEHETDAGN